MSRAANVSRSSPSQTGSRLETKVSAYDRVSSLLIALLVLVGLIVLLLFLFWLTKMFTNTKRATPVRPMELAGTADFAKGVSNELVDPGVEELADVTEPQLSQTLEAVTDAVSNVEANLEAFDGDASELGTGSGLGDSRRSGPGGGGDSDIIPRFKRWEVRFITSSRRAYAAQLDFFGIELGAVGGKTEVDYASRFSQPQPATRSGPSGQDKRLYFSYTKNNAILRQWDRQLLERAGVSTSGSGRFWVQFYPPEVENDQLAVLELQHAGADRTVKDILKTIFGVRQKGNGYEFFIMDQKYRFGS